MVTDRSNAGQRLFFALWPTPEIQQRLHGIGRMALGRHPGKLVAPESVHLTLAFLGTVPVDQIPQVEETASTVTWQALELDFDRIGWFRRARVMWVGCSHTPDSLIAYVDRLRTGLSAVGLPVDTRPFQPHVTLVRKVRRPPAQHEMEEVVCHFDHVHLVRSLSVEGGSRYEILRTWPAAAPASAAPREQ